MVSFMAQPIYPWRKSTQCPVDRTQSQSQGCTELKNLLPLPQIKPWFPSCPNHYMDRAKSDKCYAFQFLLIKLATPLRWYNTIQSVSKCDCVLTIHLSCGLYIPGSPALSHYTMQQFCRKSLFLISDMLHKIRFFHFYLARWLQSLNKCLKPDRWKFWVNIP